MKIAISDMARGYSFQLLTIVSTMAGPAAIFRIAPLVFFLPSGPLDLLYLLFLLLCMAALSCLLGVLLLGPIVLRVIAALNGAPFADGDTVRILVGPHKHRVAPIYEVWSSRGEVRVDIGEQERSTVSDVFSYREVRRCSSSSGA